MAGVRDLKFWAAFHATAPTLRTVQEAAGLLLDAFARRERTRDALRGGGYSTHDFTWLAVRDMAEFRDASPHLAAVVAALAQFPGILDGYVNARGVEELHRRVQEVRGTGAAPVYSRLWALAYVACMEGYTTRLRALRPSFRLNWERAAGVVLTPDAVAAAARYKHVALLQTMVKDPGTADVVRERALYALYTLGAEVPDDFNPAAYGPAVLHRAAEIALLRGDTDVALHRLQAAPPASARLELSDALVVTALLTGNARAFGLLLDFVDFHVPPSLALVRSLAAVVSPSMAHHVVTAVAARVHKHGHAWWSGRERVELLEDMRRELRVASAGIGDAGGTAATTWYFREAHALMAIRDSARLDEAVVEHAQSRHLELLVSLAATVPRVARALARLRGADPATDRAAEVGRAHAAALDAPMSATAPREAVDAAEREFYGLVLPRREAYLPPVALEMPGGRAVDAADTRGVGGVDNAVVESMRAAALSAGLPARGFQTDDAFAVELHEHLLARLAGVPPQRGAAERGAAERAVSDVLWSIAALPRIATTPPVRALLGLRAATSSAIRSVEAGDDASGVRARLRTCVAARAEVVAFPDTHALLVDAIADAVATPGFDTRHVRGLADGAPPLSVADREHAFLMAALAPAETRAEALERVGRLHADASTPAAVSDATGVLLNMLRGAPRDVDRFTVGLSSLAPAWPASVVDKVLALVAAPTGRPTAARHDESDRPHAITVARVRAMLGEMECTTDVAFKAVELCSSMGPRSALQFLEVFVTRFGAQAVARWVRAGAPMREAATAGQGRHGGNAERMRVLALEGVHNLLSASMELADRGMREAIPAPDGALGCERAERVAFGVHSTVVRTVLSAIRDLAAGRPRTGGVSPTLVTRSERAPQNVRAARHRALALLSDDSVRAGARLMRLHEDADIRRLLASPGDDEASRVWSPAFAALFNGIANVCAKAPFTGGSRWTCGDEPGVLPEDAIVEARWFGGETQSVVALVKALRVQAINERIAAPAASGSTGPAASAAPAARPTLPADVLAHALQFVKEEDRAPAVHALHRVLGAAGVPTPYVVRGFEITADWDPVAAWDARIGAAAIIVNAWDGASPLPGGATDVRLAEGTHHFDAALVPAATRRFEAGTNRFTAKDVSLLPATLQQLWLHESPGAPLLRVEGMPRGLLRLRLPRNYAPAIAPGVLPETLLRLSNIGGDNAPIEAGVIPASVRTVRTSSAYAQELRPGVLPAGLLGLEVGGARTVLLPGSVPDGVKVLAFARTDEPTPQLRTGVLPAALEVLALNNGYVHDFDAAVFSAAAALRAVVIRDTLEALPDAMTRALPPSLETLVVEGDHDFGATLTHMPASVRRLYTLWDPTASTGFDAPAPDVPLPPTLQSAHLMALDEPLIVRAGILPASLRELRIDSEQPLAVHTGAFADGAALLQLELRQPEGNITLAAGSLPRRVNTLTLTFGAETTIEEGAMPAELHTLALKPGGRMPSFPLRHVPASTRRLRCDAYRAGVEALDASPDDAAALPLNLLQCNVAASDFRVDIGLVNVVSMNSTAAVFGAAAHTAALVLSALGRERESSAAAVRMAEALQRSVDAGAAAAAERPCEQLGKVTPVLDELEALLAFLRREDLMGDLVRRSGVDPAWATGAFLRTLRDDAAEARTRYTTWAADLDTDLKELRATCEQFGYVWTRLPEAVRAVAATTYWAGPDEGKLVTAQDVDDAERALVGDMQGAVARHWGEGDDALFAAPRGVGTRPGSRGGVLAAAGRRAMGVSSAAAAVGRADGEAHVETLERLGAAVRAHTVPRTVHVHSSRAETGDAPAGVVSVAFAPGAECASAFVPPGVRVVENMPTAWLAGDAAGGPVALPGSVRTLSLAGSDAWPAGAVPEGVVDLSLCDSEGLALRAGMLPGLLRKLDVGCMPSSAIEPAALPARLETLRLHNVDAPLPAALFAATPALRKLMVVVTAPASVACVGVEALPRTLVQLKLLGTFDQRLAPGALPSGLQRLVLGPCFNQPLLPGALPATLASLRVQEPGCAHRSHTRFDQPILPGALPRALTRLVLGSGWNSSDLDLSVLPPLLAWLSLGADYDGRITGQPPPRLDHIRFQPARGYAARHVLSDPSDCLLFGEGYRAPMTPSYTVRPAALGGSDISSCYEDSVHHSPDPSSGGSSITDSSVERGTGARHGAPPLRRPLHATTMIDFSSESRAWEVAPPASLPEADVYANFPVRWLGAEPAVRIPDSVVSLSVERLFAGVENPESWAVARGVLSRTNVAALSLGAVKLDDIKPRDLPAGLRTLRAGFLPAEPGVRRAPFRLPGALEELVIEVHAPADVDSFVVRKPLRALAIEGCVGEYALTNTWNAHPPRRVDLFDATVLSRTGALVRATPHTVLVPHGVREVVIGADSRHVLDPRQLPPTVSRVVSFGAPAWAAWGALLSAVHAAAARTIGVRFHVNEMDASAIIPLCDAVHRGDLDAVSRVVAGARGSEVHAALVVAEALRGVGGDVRRAVIDRVPLLRGKDIPGALAAVDVADEESALAVLVDSQRGSHDGAFLEDLLRTTFSCRVLAFFRVLLDRFYAPDQEETAQLLATDTFRSSPAFVACLRESRAPASAGRYAGTYLRVASDPSV